jgi:hypothetical protein
MDLGQREMRVLEVHFLRNPAVRDLVQHKFISNPYFFKP